VAAGYQLDDGEEEEDAATTNAEEAQKPSEWLIGDFGSDVFAKEEPADSSYSKCQALYHWEISSWGRSLRFPLSPNVDALAPKTFSPSGVRCHYSVVQPSMHEHSTG